MTRIFQLRKSITAISIVILIAAIAIAVLTNGQLGSRVADILHYGDIPVGNSCEHLVIGEGAMPTRILAADMAHLVAPGAWNVDQLQDAAVVRFGETIKTNEFIKVCASPDGYQIATLNDVNLGRR